MNMRMKSSNYNQSGFPRIVRIGLISITPCLGMLSFAAISSGLVSRSTAVPVQSASPGSTCQNSVDPLSSGCDSWLARYAYPGSSVDEAAGMAITPDGTRAFVAGTSRHVQNAEDYTTVAY